jgi:hypothetical protein
MLAYSFSTNRALTSAALDELRTEIESTNAVPKAVFAFYGCTHNAGEIHRFLADRFPHAALIGGSSSGGIMDRSGIGEPSSIGLLLLCDPDGDFGAAGRPKGGDPFGAARDALHAALAAADRAGQLPDLIWIYQSPGQEEAVMQGLKSVIGDCCPIFGGSAADNDVSGQWTQIGPDGAMNDGIVIATLFPSRRIGYAFQGGYEPSGRSGIAAVGGNDSAGRVIETIDGAPAAEIYDGWIGHLIRGKLPTGGNILAETTMFPLGVDLGKVNGVHQYLLIHPETVTSDGALTTFANVESGTRLHCMVGEKRKLIERAGKVVSQAAQQLDAGEAAAALVVYCGGCRLAVGEGVAEVQRSVCAALNDIPFLGTFTFGEQGAILDRNAHGNLMISAVVFGR